MLPSRGQHLVFHGIPQTSISDNVLRQTPLEVGRVIGGYFNDRLPAVLSEVKTKCIVGQKFNELAANAAACLQMMPAIWKGNAFRSNFLAFAIGTGGINEGHVFILPLSLQGRWCHAGI